MIFAAGLGTRLKPWTDSHPKALVPVRGVPMLQRVLQRVKEAGISRVVINVHHFAGQIERFIQTNGNFGLDIFISDEREQLLDTGGGLRAVARLLTPGYGPVLVHNADIDTDMDLVGLIRAHLQSRADVTLAVADRDSSRKLYVDVDNRLVGWRNLKTGETRPAGFAPMNDAAGCSAVSFSGVHVLNPAAVIPQLAAVSDSVFGIIPFYLSHLDTLDIRAHMLPAGTVWHDIGRPESLEQANNMPV